MKKLHFLRYMTNVQNPMLRLSLLVILMLITAGVDMAWGQDYSGTYYIALHGKNKNNNNDNPDMGDYDPSNQATNYYLCPTEGWLYYKATNDFQTTDNGQPFLTSYKCFNNNKAIWSVVKSGDYYKIIHAVDGKYLVSNGQINERTENRIRVHLQDTDPGDNSSLFTIASSTKNVNGFSFLLIYPISPEGKTTGTWYLNVTDGNKNSYQGSGKNDGSPARNVGGTIGLWNIDEHSSWFAFEEYMDAPTVTYNEGQVTISSTENVYYTMTDDGTEPSNPTTTTGTSYSTSISLTEEKKYIIKAVATFTIGSGSTICYTKVSRLVVDLRQNTSTDFNGYYYLQNNDDASFYMYPNDSYVATKKKNDLSAVWQLVRDDGTGAYRIIHYKDSKYLVANPTALTNTLSLSDSQNDNSLFVIEQVVDGIYTIQPRNSSNADDNNYLNPTQGNDKNIGLSTADDSKSKWKLGKIPAKPSFSRSDITVTITPPFGDVYYKLINRDASESETDPTVATGTKGKTVTLEYGPRYKIKAISAYCYDASSNPKKYWESDVETKDYQINLVKPTISYSGSTVTISSPQNGVSFKYTIDDTDPKTSGTANTGATFTLTEGQLYKVRALAFNTVSGRTYWSSAEDVQYVNTKVQTEISLLSDIDDENGSYILTSSFSPTGSPQNSIGTSSKPFKGVIDGRLTTIESISAPLFDCVENAVIKNVIIKSAGIDASGDVGAIAREARGTTRIYNCGILDGSISGSANVGGIVGSLDDKARVINCFSNANITGGNLVGGIVGNNKVATTATNPGTMVMNCMFYGDITGGSSKAPIYNGNIITNVGQNAGVGNFNYFRAEADYVQDRDIDVYNCALAAETRYLNRFEFFRHLLNSNRALAAWWATGSADNKDEMMKWVQETSDRSITTPNTPSPYPILKPAYDSEGKIIKYPSPVNIDAAHVEDIDAKNEHYNEGRKLGTLRVYIKGVGSGAVYSAPDGAQILKEDGTPTTSEKQRYFDLNITDKDPKRYNFNYYKVQLPYYNDCGTNNYKGNRVVTGWKIIEVSDDGSVSYSTANDDAPADATAENGVITDTPYNFADRKCSNKDLYSVSGRVFSQGAYYDVPEGVTWITIEPYWAQAVYVSDPYLDKVYNVDMNAAYDVTISGQRYTDGQSGYNGDDNQKVYTTIANAVKKVGSTGNVYDNAIVLVGNTHNIGISSSGNSQYTIMSVDLDKDNEPDYSYILRFNARTQVHPVRIDFLNVIGLGMAQKSNGGTGTYNFGIMQPKGWFEVTNTGLFRVTQLEYDHDPVNRTLSPIILHGGVIEQWVTFLIQNKAANKVKYYHVGGNVWFKEFHIGAHQDRTDDVSPHPPVSVTGGDYDNFYLTGYYNSPRTNYDDNAECYINGGRFGRVAGTGVQGIGNATTHTNGNIIWQIDNADIDEFYAGGLNAAHIAEGNITTVISNSRVDLFCGGPKFGDMNPGRTVFTNATNCIFRTFFGAGYGGNSYNRRYPPNQNDVTNPNWDNWVQTEYTYKYDDDYKGVETRIDYQFLPNSGNTSNVARLFVDYVSFSLAKTHQVTTKLEDCTITTKELGRLKHKYCLGTFYGGGSLGMVDGSVTSTLKNCTVEGSVFGGGYSATLPTVSVMVKKDGKWFQTAPFYDDKLGAYLEAELPVTESATWQHGESNYYDNTTDPEHPVLYTTATLTGLGTVEGDVTLNIDGDNTLILGSVYGGGQDSQVDGNTYVTVTGGTIGGVWDEEKQRYQGGAYYGNVYGGGMGKWDDVADGLVTKNTNVTISGSPHIFHNVYGGGAFASVGTFTYDSDLNIPTAATWADNTGICTVTITGGEFGWNGQDNGMICGASRGDDEHYYIYEKEEGKETSSYVSHATQVNKLAWVNRTNVIIGSSDPEDESTILIKGSVYGGGENGHNLRDASVKIYKGTIGIVTREANDSTVIVSDGKTYKGPEYDNRGNVYGAGCGTDNYKQYRIVDGDESEELLYTHYNPMAGIVCGDTKVEMFGGHVVRSIYGAGAMGSAGTFNIVNGKVEGMASGYETTGKSEVIVSGGIVGTTGMHMPDDWGYVFGGGKGKTIDPLKSNVENIQYVRETNVNIKGSAFIIGAVYGGAENGHVLENTNVLIEGGQIGCGENKTAPYKDEDFIDPRNNEITTGNSLEECAHWEFRPPYDSYDVLPLSITKTDNVITAYETTDDIADATDGHTFYGNVFGGGSGYFPYGRNPNLDLGKVKKGYADGLWLRSAGSVGGNATVNITGGHILTNVYGGNECTDVDGKCTINMSGGTVGVPRTKEQIQAHPVTCYVFGAGKGDPRINFNQWTNVGSTEVKITGGIVYGSVFGGGEDGHVIGDAKMTISEESGKPTIIGSVGTSGADGNIFGGGRGFSETALTAGAVCGTVNVEIKGGTMLGSVFGGGRLASVGSHIVLVEEPHHYYGTLIPDGKKQVFGNFDDNITTNDFPEDVDESGLKHGHITVNISGGTIGSSAASTSTAVGNVFTGCKGTTNTTEPFGLSKSTKLTISSTSEEEGKMTHIYGTVYGGGEAGDVEQNVEVNINGGIIDGGVYGGGAKANTNIKWTDADGQRYDTKVNLHGGTIGSDVFGGGLGQKANAGLGLADIEAIVGGDVTVELNKGSEDDCVVKGRIFGCNNLKGTPRGNVTVHVYKTQGWGENVKGDKDNSKYELEAVYGGGNEAAYVPRDTYSYNEETGIYTYPQIADDATDKSKTNVIIDGCDLSSIEYVYGGGNSAPTPATSVTVNSCYEIGTVFGGGNGADNLSDGTPNLGANVGYRNYSYFVAHGAEANPRYNVYDYDGTYPEGSPYATAATVGDRRTHYKYGTGRAETKLYGGTIHNAFGGSNTLGNVCAVAFSVIDQGNDCSLNVGQIYGAGNKAKMDARIELNLGCITGFNELFGGAFDADINENVKLEVTSGTYGSVYGGNNKGGHINGTITVEVNETGCHPVEIGSLYGGGKDADYIAPADHQDSPTVKVISATKIDKIYGGGCNADVTGNPTVEINMIPGTLYKGVSGKETPQELGTIGTVFGGGYNGKVIGDTKVLIGTKDKDENNNPISAHITGSVYGGGENANVEGKTEVIIGKE